MNGSLNTEDLASLRSSVRGEVITPAEDEYEAARRLFYGNVEKRPTGIVRVTDADDVAATISFATNRDIDFTVRSGGHSVAGHGGVDDGLVIDVRELNRIDLDPSARTVWAGSGLTAAELTAATGDHGLAVGFGDTGSVGIGGITLGGGVGFLARKHGLTIDSLLAAEIVTPSGEVIVADANNHPDLFWAIRGGGGNFGVATRFKYALHPVDKIVGGMIVLPATRDTVAGFIAESEAAPEELSTIANVMTGPAMPLISEDLVGETVIMGLFAWCGDLTEGHRMVDLFRNLAEPLADMVAEISYPEIYAPEDEDYQPTAFGLNGFSDDLTDDHVTTILEAVAASDAPMRVVQIRALQGAVARVPADATAYAHRDRKLMINTASFYESETDRPRRAAWVRELHSTLTSDDAAYVGFLDDEGEDRIRAAYPGTTWSRLREIKGKYDPDNLFHHNQNIPPDR